MGKFKPDPGVEAACIFGFPLIALLLVSFIFIVCLTHDLITGDATIDSKGVRNVERVVIINE